MESTQTDLTELSNMLTDYHIAHELRPHPIYDKIVEELLGYNPAGTHQIIVQNKLSIIRGPVSFGQFEVMSLEERGRFKYPEGFETAVEALKAIISEVMAVA